MLPMKCWVVYKEPEHYDGTSNTSSVIHINFLFRIITLKGKGFVHKFYKEGVFPQNNKKTLALVKFSSSKKSIGMKNQFK